MKAFKTLKVVKIKDIRNAYTTIGADEVGILLRMKNNPHAKPIAAVFNRKQFLYKRPLLSWRLM